MSGESQKWSGAVHPFGGRLWVKLMLAYLLPVALILAGIGFLAYRAARVALEEQLGDSLVAVARTAAGQAGMVRALQLAPGDESTRTYANLKERLLALKAAARVELIYLFDRQGRALVDSDNAFAVGEPILKLAADGLELREVFSGGGRASVLFTGRDERLYKSGFAPLEHQGRVAAAVGVDGSARFFGPLATLGRSLALVGALALALIVAVTLFVSRRITRPLIRLAQSARDIGRGQLDLEIGVETSDEIGVLASTLNEMRRSIRQRDRRLQMMLAGIAHEVRNPLGGMSLFAGLLKEELAGNAAGQKHLEKITTELDYLSRVVTDFLDFTRQRPLEPEELDPRAEFEQVEHLCAPDLRQAGVRLVCVVSAEASRVRWDRQRMRRVILNLVRNAVQASPRGEEIELRLDREGAELVLRVSDRGCGIPEEKRAQLFEPFYTTRQQGTGLGLALVMQIVEAHGGSISFASETGRGTTFIVRLPAEH